MTKEEFEKIKYKLEECTPTLEFVYLCGLNPKPWEPMTALDVMAKTNHEALLKKYVNMMYKGVIKVTGRKLSLIDEGGK